MHWPPAQFSLQSDGSGQVSSAPLNALGGPGHGAHTAALRDCSLLTDCVLGLPGSGLSKWLQQVDWKDPLGKDNSATVFWLRFIVI